MYNGVGVSTSRGTGTNGYVQKSLSHIRSRREDLKNWKVMQSETSQSTFHGPDSSLLEHNLKRRAELLLLPLRDKLEADGIDEAEIDYRLSEERTRLKSELLDGDLAVDRSSTRDTHQVAFDMAVRDSRAAVAFGIDLTKRPSRSRSRSRS
jgi:serine/arginine repetitive matrix protein 2